MGEHVESTESRDESRDATQALPSTAPEHGGQSRHRARRTSDWRATARTVLGLLGSVVRWACLLFALLLVVHVVFVIGEANVDNGIVSFVEDASHHLSLGFQDLFTWEEDPKLSVLVNYGIAAIFWLVVSTIVTRVIRVAGGRG